VGNSAYLNGAKKQLGSGRPFGNTLIVGAGPAGIQIAVNICGWSTDLGLVNRKSLHGDRLKKELEEAGYTLAAKTQDAKYQDLSGEARLTHFYEGYDGIHDNWKTLIICTPSDSYKDIIKDLKVDSLQKVKTIILVSPGLGSNLLVKSQLKRESRIEVISFSTYYAATKFEPGNLSVRSSFTKVIKKRIYIASSHPNRTTVLEVKRFIESLGIQCLIVRNALEAESRNITMYVHPPFFINEISLDEIFSDQVSRKYMYKLYPEGPITQQAIRTMVQLWKEISGLIQYFGAKPLNLLQFLNDDNYPVPEISLSREDIQNFMIVGEIKQEYLLYIRYTSILIDPFSTPDDHGKYFDFSAVPYKQVYQDQNGKWVLPRIPFEDYQKLKLLYGLARKTNISMSQTLNLIHLFDKKVNQFVSEKGENCFCPEVFADTSDSDATAILSEINSDPTWIHLA
jgi:hypothetical protein